MEPRYRLTTFEALVIITLLAAAAAAQQAVQPPTEEEQEGAVGCMRTINTAEMVYAATYGKSYSPTLVSLAEGAQGQEPTASAAGLIDTSLGSGKRSGYIYTYRPGPKDAQGQIKTYIVTARPMKWQKDVLSVFTDQTGVIRVTKENRAANGKDPAPK